jgi:hypothetical protein
MMQAIGVAVIVLSGLLMVSIAAVLLPVVFTFRPFDYRKVSYRTGVLFVIMLPLAALGVALSDDDFSQLSVDAVLKIVLLVVISVLIALVGSYIGYRSLRSASEKLARRDAILAERRRQREAGGDGGRTRG